VTAHDAPTVEQRIAALEARLESAFAIDARLRALDAKVSDLQPKTPGKWDKIQILGSYISGLLVLVVGYVINDSVTHALDRQKLDLEYASQIRDLILEFDKADTVTAADANAIGLAMFGKYAIPPLLQRLNAGDVASNAAEKGLQLIAVNFGADACPRYEAILTDHGRLYSWQTHRTIIRVMGRGKCTVSLFALQKYADDLSVVTPDDKSLQAFAGARYASVGGFDYESVQTLQGELKSALEILNAEWWR
jgi:hypothetical protein